MRMQLANLTAEEAKIAVEESRRHLEEAERILNGYSEYEGDAPQLTRLHFHLNEGSRQFNRLRTAAKRQLWFTKGMA